MNVRMVIPHRVMSALVALVLAAVVVAVPAPAQAVSGGGCASRSGQVGQYNWVTVQSCISLPTRNLRPDIYIGGGTYSNCYVYVDLYTNTGLKFTRIVGCANGHYGPWEYRVFPPDAGFAYTRSRVLWNGWELFRVDSPSVYWP